MRNATRFSTVMVMVVATATGCALDGDDQEPARLLPDACATAVVPPDAAPDSQPSVCGITAEGTLVLGQAVTGSTVGRTNTYAPSCGYGSSPDIAYRFVAPDYGTYVFTMNGSTYEAVFEIIHPASCGSMACNYAGGGGPAVLTLDAGQEVVIVLDGYGFTQGNYSLRADVQAVCSPQVVSGSLPFSTTVTLSGTSRWSSACGGSGPDANFRYTIPADGVYVFDTIGSSVDTQLYVRGDCNGSEYACDDNGATSGAATLSNYLYEGSVFEFVVDTNTSGGTVQFNISGPPPPPPPPACPETSIGSVSPQTINGTTVGAASVLYGNCGGDGPEKTYAFTAPAAGMYQFDTSGSQGDTVLYVRSGSCSGAELACNDDATDFSSLVQVQLAQNETVVIIVDSYTAGQPYSLHVSGPL